MQSLLCFDFTPTVCTQSPNHHLSGFLSCSKVCGSIPTCPRQSGSSLQRATPRLASPSNTVRRPLPAQSPSHHLCTLSQDVSTIISLNWIGIIHNRCYTAGVFNLFRRHTTNQLGGVPFSKKLTTAYKKYQKRMGVSPCKIGYVYIIITNLHKKYLLSW